MAAGQIRRGCGWGTTYEQIACGRDRERGGTAALYPVDQIVRRGSDLRLTEYLNEQRYRADYPDCVRMRELNAVVREAMREAVRRGIYCVRRLIRPGFHWYF